jgi:hypothetical protein
VHVGPGRAPELRSAASLASHQTAEITTHFNSASIRDMPSVGNDNSNEYRTLRKAFVVARANNHIDFNESSGPLTVRVRRQHKEFHDGSNVWLAINDAIMMGTTGRGRKSTLRREPTGFGRHRLGAVSGPEGAAGGLQYLHAA